MQSEETQKWMTLPLNFSKLVNLSLNNYKLSNLQNNIKFN